MRAAPAAPDARAIATKWKLRAQVLPARPSSCLNLRAIERIDRSIDHAPSARVRGNVFRRTRQVSSTLRTRLVRASRKMNYRVCDASRTRAGVAADVCCERRKRRE